MSNVSSRPRGRRRAEDALSRQTVVEAAAALLDERGERGLTFPALTERLHTGNGAIYWHVANKDELVALAADHILGQTLPPTPSPAPGRGDAVDAVRSLALDAFDALDRHPWAAAHVTASPALPNALRLLEQVGTLTTAIGVPPAERFNVATALFNYMIGVSAQIAGTAATIGATTPRDDYLAKAAQRWQALDPADYPFLARSADDFLHHDDRQQYTAGLELLLAGLNATHDQQ